MPSMRRSKICLCRRALKSFRRSLRIWQSAKSLPTCSSPSTKIWKQPRCRASSGISPLWSSTRIQMRKQNFMQTLTRERSKFWHSAIKSCSRRIQMAGKMTRTMTFPMRWTAIWPPLILLTSTRTIWTPALKSTWKFSIRRVQKRKPSIRPKRSCTRPLPPSRRKSRSTLIFSCTTFKAAQWFRSRERPCGSTLPSTSPKSRTTRFTK